MSVGLIIFQSDWLQCDLDTGWFVKNFANVFCTVSSETTNTCTCKMYSATQQIDWRALTRLGVTCAFSQSQIKPQFKAFWCCQCRATHVMLQQCRATMFFARDRVEGVQIHQTVSIFEQCWMYDNVNEELYIYSRAITIDPARDSWVWDWGLQVQQLWWIFQ